MSLQLINVQFKSSFKASKGWLEKFLKRNNITHINKEHYGKDSEILKDLSIDSQSSYSHIFETEQS